MSSNPFIQALGLVTDTGNIYNKYIKNPTGLQTKQEIETAINQNTVQVMIYGAYNAGKSTLINALLKSNQAKVNDIPTTDSVDVYNYDGIQLLDTPGVNAPIKHENVTLEQIKRSNLFLFVIRAEDVDAKDIYQRIFELLKDNREVFIVYNHSITSGEDLEQAKDQLNRCLSKVALDYNVSNDKLAKINIYPINLQRATKGVFESKPVLIEKSGINEFILAFKQWLINFDTKHGYLEQVKTQIKNTWFLPVSEELNRKISTSDNSELTLLNSSLAMWQNKKSLNKQSINSCIKSQVSQRQSSLRSAIEAGKKSELDKTITSICEAVEVELKSLFDSCDVEIDKIFIDYDDSNINNSFEGATENKFIKKTINVTSQLKDSGVLGKGVESLAEKALLWGRTAKLPMLKGRWGSTLAKLANKTGKVANVAIPVITSAIEIYMAHAQEQKYNEHMAQRALKIQQLTEQISSDIIAFLVKSYSEAISDFYDPAITEVLLKLNEYKAGMSGLNQDKQIINEALAQLSSLSIIQ